LIAAKIADTFARVEKGFWIADLTSRRCSYGGAEVDGNYKSQNPNNKQITMTKIQNSKRSHHLQKREPQICLGH
jgi:hypothetical protein